MARVIALIVCLGALAVGAVGRAAPKLEDYGRDAAVSLIQLSPSGDRYVYVATEAGARRLVVATTDGKPPASFGIGSARVIRLDWAGDDHLLISVAAVGDLGPQFNVPKAWLTSVFALNLKTRTMFKVFDGKPYQVAGFVEGNFGARLIGGRWYGFFGGLNTQRTKATPGSASMRDLYQVDLDDGSARLVSHGSDQDDGWLVGPTGDVVARYQYQWGTGDWRVLSGASGETVLTAGHSAIGAGGDLVLGRSADQVLFARPPDTEGLAQWEILPLSGGDPSFVPDSDRIYQVVSDAATGLWIGNLTDDGGVQMFAPGVDRDVHKALDGFRDRTAWLQGLNDALTRMIVYTSGSADSGTYWLVDLPSGKVEPVGYDRPAIQPSDVGPVRMVAYPAADGLPLHGVLSLPPGIEAKGLPLVLLPHGQLGNQDMVAFDSFAQAIASRGYAVFQPNSRGSYGYGAALYRAGFGQVGRKIQTDISDGVAELARQGLIDPKRVCIVGSGWGGYAALAGVTLQQGLYRCAVSIMGIANLNETIANSEKPTFSENGMTRYLREAVGAASDADLKAISPVANAARADAPILLIYDKDDLGLTSAQSLEMAAALRRAGKPVETVALTVNGDPAASETGRIERLRATVDFLEKYDPPAAAGDAAATAR